MTVKRSSHLNKEISKSAFGEQLTVSLVPIFQNSFEYTVDNTELTINTIVNGGTVTQASGMGIMTSSTTTASTALMESKSHARYRSGQGGLARFTVLFTVGVAATEQLAGLADEVGSSVAFKNGYMVGFIGDTFGVHVFQNDTVTTTTIFSEDQLDGAGLSGMNIDTTKINVFEIRFQYLGAGEIQFYVENPETGLFFIFHRVKYANNNTSPSVHNPNFHLIMWVNNKATTSNLILKTGSFAYFVEGITNLTQVHQPHFSSGNVTKTTVTTETAIFTIRNKSTYQSKTNFIEILLEHFTASIEASSANNLGSIRLVKNATLGGSPVYSDIDTSDSVVDMDTAGTTLTGGKEFLSINMAGKNDRIFQIIKAHKFILNPGDTVTLAGTSANSATIEGALLWRELF